MEENGHLDSMEVLKWLNDEERERFLKFEEVFGTAGWKLLSEWAGLKALEQMQNAANSTTWDRTCRAQGARIAYQEVADWATSFMAEFSALASERAEEIHDDE